MFVDIVGGLVAVAESVIFYDRLESGRDRDRTFLMLC
jgi:hypothetical protein